ncbi:hypothetical protein PCC9214_05805 [Planktothrix tepida]|uniref:Double-GTPase 1 domain-containing protein n=1 Tax=Planktothrix tepida PCC 9214 TaxID=671072 RepID=A0A1J1LSL9_9CYAN|nr:hypothetical protein [Planktothrix tepida]CAD5990473.1 hypothetical protein PCC9214_05805 [Planktothrix tepida]CUR35399.1 conserved hypothetical protein [Planktothrix tepida PCC 9214]
MRIVMLGHTEVGKTTYMASLYGVLQQSVEGFRLKAANSEDHNRLLNLAEKIHQGQYPLATDQRSEYEFKLRYQSKDILSFTWGDYRGGAIRETQDSEQARLLLEDLRQADGIMMFCDCDALLRGNRRSNQLGRMVTLASNAVRDLKRPISLAIILTKVDLVPEFNEDLLFPFSGLIKTIEVSEWVLGALIPVACGTQFINVPMPLLFALHAAVFFKAATLAHLVENHYSKALDWEEKSQGFSGFVRWVNDKWNGATTDKQLAQKEMEKALDKYKDFELIKEPTEALIEIVQKLPLIQKDIILKEYVKKINQAYNGVKFNSRRTGSLYETYSDPFDAFN